MLIRFNTITNFNFEMFLFFQTIAALNKSIVDVSLLNVNVKWFEYLKNSK